MALEANISIGARETASKALDNISKSARNLGTNLKGAGESGQEAGQKMGGLTGLLNRLWGANVRAGNGMDKLGRDASELKGKLNAVGVASKGLMASMAPLLALFAAVRAVQGFANMLGQASEAYLIQEKAALGATEAQRQHANAMQRVLGVGDEVTLQMARQAEAMGVSKEQSMEAAQAAIGLAKATGTEQKEALKKVSQALQGNTAAMAEGIPAVRTATTETEKWAAINETVTRGLEMQRAEMQGVEGVLTRANNSWGDFLEVIGNLLAPMRAIVSQGVAVFAETMQAVLVPAVEAANAALENLPSIFQTVNRVVVGGITAVEVVLTNLPQVAQLVTAKLALYWEGLKEDALALFTVTLPKIAEWFRENWSNLLYDAFTLVVTYYKNRFIQMKDLFVAGFQATLDVAEWAAENLPTILYNAGVAVIDTVGSWLVDLGGIFQQAWDTITSYWTGGVTDVQASMTSALAAAQEKAIQTLAAPPQSAGEHAARFGEILSRNLLEGWESTTEPLPDLIGRDLTKRERDLMAKVSDIAGSLGEEFSTKFADRMAAVNDTFADFTNKSNLVAEGAAGMLGKAARAGNSLTASDARLTTRGPSEDPAERIAQLNEQANRWLEKIFEKETDTRVETVEAIA